MRAGQAPWVTPPLTSWAWHVGSCSREARRPTHRVSSWPWTGDTGVRGPLGRRKQKCKVMQSDANTARTEIWDSSFPLSSLPVFLSFLETPPPSLGSGRHLGRPDADQAFCIIKFLPQKDQNLKHPRPLSHSVAFYFPTPITPSSMSLLKMTG